MATNSQTPLAGQGMAEPHLAFLRSLWIESVEEFAALMAAVADKTDSLASTGFADAKNAAATALAALSPDRATALARPRSGGTLGYVIDPQVMNDFRQYGRVRPMTAKPLLAFSRQLPPAMRLMDKLPPVRNQGQRGACVAFGTVALREFLIGAATDLSEQFLYWACKELDGHPGPGTYIHTAMTAMAEYGVCEESVWEYNPNPTGDDEGQGPPPNGAAAAALNYRLTSSRTVEPNLVLHYKNVLVDESGNPGMPVTFGTLVFDSWYMSAETHRTGKITLPLPGEEPAGGHAWCVVGYVDNASVPGGGYFIVRNSWGDSWAADSPEAPGHAMMPYEYVERYAMEAFTGPAGEAATVQHESPGTALLKNHVRALEKDEHEISGGIPQAGRLVSPPASVLCDPLNPAAIMEDNEVNRRAFARRDFTWLDSTRRSVWFSDPARFSPETNSTLEAVRAARDRFDAAIHSNMFAAKGAPFPQLHFPPWFHLIPFEWEPKIKQVQEVADLTEDVLEFARKSSGAPEGLAWPEAWRELLSDLNRVKVISLKRGGKLVHVVSAFLTRLEPKKNGDPALRPPGQPFVDAVYEAYLNWCKSPHQSGALFCVLTIGAAERPAPSLLPSASGRCWKAVSFPAEGGRWQTLLPEHSSSRISFQQFLDRMTPETRDDRIACVRRCVDGLILDDIHATDKRVADRTGYRPAAVNDAFLALQEHSPDSYRIYRTRQGELAVEKSRQGDQHRITARSLRGSFIRRHALHLLATAVGVSGWLLRDTLKLAGVTGYILFIVFLYISSCVQAEINRRASQSMED